jgi:hypothetical protein
MSEYLDSNIEVESNSYIFGGKDNKNKKDINKNKKDINKNKKNINKNKKDINKNKKDNNKNKKDNNKNLIEYDKKNKFYLIRENKKIEELSNEWCYQKYQELWKFNPMNNIKNLPINIEHSSIIRMFNLNILKYINLYNSMDTIVIVFKLYDGNINKETNYAILFAYLYESAVIKIESKRRVNFSFYSCGPSYISCDGEYRSKFNWFNNVEISKTILFRQLWIDLEDYVKNKCISRKWINTISYFYPKINEERKNIEIELLIKEKKINMTLLVISWFNETYNAMFNLQEIHINENFKEIFYKYAEEDIEFLKLIIKKYDSNTIENFKSYISINNKKSLHNKIDNLYLNQGIKMIPLNIKEVQDPIKLKYKPWREFLITQRTGDLVINAIAPGFAIIGDWMYIKNSKKGLFDNISQYKKMQHSEIAKDIVHILYEAQRNTYFAKSTIDVESKSEKRFKEWVSGKFKKLNEKINNSIDYCIEDIIMSEVTLAFTSEYLGRTIADTIKIIEFNEKYDSYIGNPLSNKGYDYFAKYMFEICYNLYCMNTKLGIIHNDLHLNNAVLGAIYYSSYKDKMKIKNPSVLYVVDNEHQYLFPTTGYYTGIIDFSRSIIHYEKYNLFQDQSLPKTYNIVSNVVEFKNNEINNLLNIFIQMFPSRIKQKEELVVLFKNHYESVFRLLTTMDIYIFSLRMIKILNESNYKVNKKCIELLDQMNKLSEFYITTEMNHLINNPENYSKIILNREYPIHTIMEKCFYEYINSNKKTTIIDIFVHSNEIKYSLDKYELFPPIIKEFNTIVNNKVVRNDVVSNNRKIIREYYENIKTKNLDMMNYISKRHLEKIY